MENLGNLKAKMENQIKYGYISFWLLVLFGVVSFFFYDEFVGILFVYVSSVGLMHVIYFKNRIISKLKASIKRA